VTSYAEEDARGVFQGGNAAFMRNWPYAYSTASAERSPIRGQFAVSPLPHGPGQQTASTVGGWQLGVSLHSRQQAAAIELVRYLTSPEAQRYRAIVGAFIPTLRAAQDDADVLRALPFLPDVRAQRLVTRPSSQSGARYNELSIAFFQGVSEVLLGSDPSHTLAQMERRLQGILR
jgi:trehalose/maltose transport system substrate-binding protein